MPRFGGLLRLRDVPAREVAAAHVKDLALLHQHLHRLPHIFPRRGALDVVHLVQVDVVGLEPAQAGVARLADVIRRHALVVDARPHRIAQLGRQHDSLAVAAAGPFSPMISSPSLMQTVLCSSR